LPPQKETRPLIEKTKRKAHPGMLLAGKKRVHIPSGATTLGSDKKKGGYIINERKRGRNTSEGKR